jgi:hypothetical protein
MEEAIQFVSPMHCHHCGKPAVDIYDIYEHAIGYTSVVKNFTVAETLQFINDQKNPLSYMRCTNCGCLYLIDWSRGIPRPLYHCKVLNYKNIRGKHKP